MKYYCLVIVCCLIACQTPEESTTSEVVDQAESVESLLEANGIEMLNAWYQTGQEASRKQIDQLLGLSLPGDLLYELRQRPDSSMKAFVTQTLQSHIEGLSAASQQALHQKALKWLEHFQSVNYDACKLDGEDYLAAIYSVPEFAILIDKRINPQIGQGYYSLASGQIDEVEHEVWLLLTEMSPEESKRVTDEFLKVCASFPRE